MKNNKGQSLVEYLLLLVVIATLTNAILNSGVVRDLLGPQGRLMTFYKTTMEYNYRHALPYNGSANPLNDYSNYTGRHDSYNVSTADSRFFVPVNAYP